MVLLLGREPAYALGQGLAFTRARARSPRPRAGRGGPPARAGRGRGAARAARASRAARPRSEERPVGEKAYVGGGREVQHHDAMRSVGLSCEGLQDLRSFWYDDPTEESR